MRVRNASLLLCKTIACSCNTLIFSCCSSVSTHSCIIDCPYTLKFTCVCPLFNFTDVSHGMNNHIFFSRSSTHSTDMIVAKHAIRQHQMKVISGRDEEDRQRLHVRRSNLVKDTIKAFSRPTFDVSKIL